MDLSNSMLKDGLKPTLLLLLASWLGYCTYVAVHRLYLSPLASFPGPKLAAVTGLYEDYFDLVSKGGGQFVFEIQRMHAKYGPIVRINPDELHVADAKFFEFLYSTGKMYDKQAKMQHRFSIPGATFSTANAEHHRVRRAAISPFFSRAKVREQGPQVQFIMDRISDRLRTEFSGTGKVVNVQHMWSTLAADVVTDVIFARPANLHTYPDFKAPFTTAVHTLAVWTHVTQRLSGLLPLLNSLPDGWAKFVFPPFVPVLAFRRELWTQVLEVVAAHETKGANVGRKTVFHEMLASTALSKADRQAVRLHHESQSLVGAGFETTAWTMTVATFHILDKPAVLERLTAELEAAIPDPECMPGWETLGALPYLHSVVKESLRHSLGAAERLPRVNNHGTWTYGEWTIPPGVAVSMDAWHMHQDPEVFGPDPTEFRPERWLGDPRVHGKPLASYLATFSRGSRMCLGLHLAYAELYIGLATLFRRHELRLFETTARDVKFFAEYAKPSPWPGSKGVRFVVVR